MIKFAQTFCQQLRTYERCVDISGRHFCVHYHQGGSEPARAITTTSLTICFFVLDDSGSSADTCFDTEQPACPQPAAFPIQFSQHTHKTPSTYVYTSFVSDLVLAKFKAVGKTSRQTLLLNRLYRPVLAAYCVGTLPSLQN